jgi:hypothetical protein
MSEFDLTCLREGLRRLKDREIKPVGAMRLSCGHVDLCKDAPIVGFKEYCFVCKDYKSCISLLDMPRQIQREAA